MPDPKDVLVQLHVFCHFSKKNKYYAFLFASLAKKGPEAIKNFMLNSAEHEIFLLIIVGREPQFRVVGI